MDFKELVNKRYSVRAYKRSPVGKEKLLTILNAARLAPTANNRQPFQILVIHTKGREQQLLSMWFTCGCLGQTRWQAIYGC
jgi:nitroreductase